MALINEDIKRNLANNLVANFDETGEGTGVNGQPLQVDANGNLKITQESFSTSAQEYLPVNADSNGNLNLGGLDTSVLLSDASPFVNVVTYSNIDDLIVNMPNQLNDFLNSISDGASYRRIYGYKQEIIHDNPHFHVILSAWGGNTQV